MRKIISIFVCLGGLLIAFLLVVAPTVSRNTINDVTQLNPITVDRILAPTTLDDITAAVASHPGPISIGGGRYSMGGQTATDASLFLDMRSFDKVVSFAPERREITVQAGITWRKIQDVIDPYNLSVMIMQSYANFTVGGALSVNAHGRYVGLGPVILSVAAITLVRADGTVVHASPTEHADLFYGAIGGYGGLGVIAEATLRLADNTAVARRSDVMPLSAYTEYFSAQVRTDTAAVFHNADIYPPAFDTVRATTWRTTDQPPTVTARLHRTGDSHYLSRTVTMLVSLLPYGRQLRAALLDPWLYRAPVVQWRNYEASYDVQELEPFSRRFSTFVLQEYFVPAARLAEFTTTMRTIFQAHNVNVINVSIRHANADPGSLLAWAREECFAFVVYYKQDTSASARDTVGRWTRELIDAAVAAGGTYYLPYQLHATPEQFLRAYPRAEEFFALKRRVDPTNKFRNKLWDMYFPNPRLAADVYFTTHVARNRPEAQTYLTLPEWYIVYNSQELAQHLRQSALSDFPFFRSIGTFWKLYRQVCTATAEQPFNAGYHAMIWTIGASFTVEYAIKGAYEATVGRATAWLSDGARTEEDRLAEHVYDTYVASLDTLPWYKFDFWSALRQLWQIPFRGDHWVRKWERKFAYSVEYISKAVWAQLIEWSTGTTYADDEIITAVRTLPSSPAAADAERLPDGSAIHALPRYQPFLPAIMQLARTGADFIQIAGNHRIALSYVRNTEFTPPGCTTQFTSPIVTNPTVTRWVTSCTVHQFAAALRDFAAHDVAIEHAYDY